MVEKRESDKAADCRLLASGWWVRESKTTISKGQNLNRRTTIIVGDRESMAVSIPLAYSRGVCMYAKIKDLLYIHCL
jgi:hypothetical protein